MPVPQLAAALITPTGSRTQLESNSISSINGDKAKRTVSIQDDMIDNRSPDGSPPHTPMVCRSRLNLNRQRSISWSSVCAQAKQANLDAKLQEPVAEGEIPQGETAEPIVKRSLWSGKSFSEACGGATGLRSFGSATCFDFGGAETPTLFPRAASFGLTTGLGSCPATPRAKYLPIPDSPAPPTGPRDRTYGGCLGEKEDENEGRFQREFSEVEKIGEGHFSHVFRARNNVDRCLYAVKRTKQIGFASARQVQEAFVLASMAMEAEGCPNIVRYFSSWFEGSQLFIQMELCSGTLRQHLVLLNDGFREDITCCNRKEILEVLSSVAGGLASMHNCGFVHLDIKPDNIMRGRSSGKWKIGDFGLAVASWSTGCDEVCEGDCRYLAREVLQGDLKYLSAADVFSLGIVAYEMATNPKPLPVGGDEWQTLRDGVLDASSLLASQGADLHEHLSSLVQPNAALRPACQDILEFCKSASSSAVAAPQAPRDRVATDSEEVAKLKSEIEELGRTAQENRQMADKYREELIRLRSRTASESLRGHKAAFCGDLGEAPKSDELIRSYSM